jgi:hypothetical protein
MKYILIIFLISNYFTSFSQINNPSTISKIDPVEKTQNTDVLNETTSINEIKKSNTQKKIKSTDPKSNEPNYPISKWIGLAASLISILAFFIPIYRYLSQKREEQKDKRFITYHKLIADLVNAPGGMLDRQIAIVFEFRNFPDYFDLSKRIITDLKEQWKKLDGNERLITEMEFALKHIVLKTKWHNRWVYIIFGIK